MSARDVLETNIDPAVPDGGRSSIDAYREEVLAKAIGRLRAIPVDCTALTGPVWYGDGWNSAIRCLEEIADYQGPDDEEYPGELQRLRATVLALRVAALRKEDLARVQQVLTDHEDWRKKATAAAPTATPEFFQVGRTYSEPGDTTDWRFRCDAITTHPETGERTALGWKHFRGQWSECSYPESEWEIHQIADALAATARPLPAVGVTDTNRRARLLHEMALGARWKSGDVVAWYQTQGLTGLGTRAARHDLAVLRDSGAITQHDEKGVRFYTRATHNTNTGNPA